MIYDISMEIKNGMVFYEGDPAPQIKLMFGMPEKPCNVSKLDMGAHTGTHIDAPDHWIKGGKKTGTIPMEGYLVGKCKVFDLTKKDVSIEAEDLKTLDIRKDDIILLKTKNSYDPLKRFNRNFIYVAPSAVDYFLKKKIRTIGTDYLSVEKFGSEDHYTHRTLLGSGVVIIEGLRLGEIKPGRYKLSCLPLKIDADGAPARAILEDL